MPRIAGLTAGNVSEYPVLVVVVTVVVVVALDDVVVIVREVEVVLVRVLLHFDSGL